MTHELPKTYDPASFEDRLYQFWEESGYFKPTNKEGAPNFSIVIPPPNVTGQLHMGHALNNTLQDILVRYKRMCGYNTLWVPGTDHAGIATQIKVEEMLRKEKGLSRHDIGRDEFLKLVWEWKAKYGGRIISQLKKMGSSCDWSHERFTMDENLSRAVKKVFVRLYDKGLIYQGLRITNICPHCNTALSDAEVEHKEVEGHFWHIRYPVKGSEGEYVTIATTRPETMLGDSAVAVHPEDERYTHLVGKTLILPLSGREIPVIADDYVDREFGTGCVKVTPCHDPNDFEMGLRHNLEQIVMLDNTGKICGECSGKYTGMDRFEARKAIVADLEEQGYLVKVESHSHNVAHCYRCGSIVEPIASKQWFVRMKPLAEPAIEVVKNGDIRYIPDRFSKIYLNWMENIHDWCISRQLWWGHRIPAYYCDDCGEVIVAEEAPKACPKCGKPMRQEEDVLDTWFSSALWPFSTLGWPDDTEDLKRFYPTSALVTAYDIITFWVSKMIFMGIENMGGDNKPISEQIPFPDVFIHGLVRDAQGRKMSKSLGNGIDPLEIIEQYGADALRFALATGNSPGNDMRFSDEKIESARNFANKIWNATRFVLMNLDIEDASLPEADKLTLEDKWLLSQYNRLIGEVRTNLDNYELGVALSKLYDFIWDVFCDWYIELAKIRLSDKGSEGARNVQKVLVTVLSGTMKLLHPFLPFITEEIWQSLPHEGDSIMIADYPTQDDAMQFETEEKTMTRVLDAIKAIRRARAEKNVPPSKKAKVYLVSDYRDAFDESTTPFFTRLASASEVILCADEDVKAENALRIITDSAVLYIPMAELVDLDAEKARLAKEKENLLKEIDRIDKKLANEGFLAKAPASVVESEKAKRQKYADTLSATVAALANLG